MKIARELKNRLKIKVRNTIRDLFGDKTENINIDKPRDSSEPKTSSSEKPKEEKKITNDDDDINFDDDDFDIDFDD